jgi:hypothetical protein
VLIAEDDMATDGFGGMGVWCGGTGGGGGSSSFSVWNEASLFVHTLIWLFFVVYMVIPREEIEGEWKNGEQLFI